MHKLRQSTGKKTLTPPSEPSEVRAVLPDIKKNSQPLQPEGSEAEAEPDAPAGATGLCVPGDRQPSGQTTGQGFQTT